MLYLDIGKGYVPLEDGHIYEDMQGRRNVVAEGKCAGFVPHGPFEYDEYYCGHDGWD